MMRCFDDRAAHRAWKGVCWADDAQRPCQINHGQPGAPAAVTADRLDNRLKHVERSAVPAAMGVIADIRSRLPESNHSQWSSRTSCRKNTRNVIFRRDWMSYRPSKGYLGGCRMGPRCLHCLMELQFREELCVALAEQTKFRTFPFEKVIARM